MLFLYRSVSMIHRVTPEPVETHGVRLSTPNGHVYTRREAFLPGIYRKNACHLRRGDARRTSPTGTSYR